MPLSSDDFFCCLKMLMFILVTQVRWFFMLVATGDLSRPTSDRRTALDQSLKKIWPTADAQQVKKMGDLLTPGLVLLSCLFCDFPHGKTMEMGNLW